MDELPLTRYRHYSPSARRLCALVSVPVCGFRASAVRRSTLTRSLSFGSADFRYPRLCARYRKKTGFFPLAVRLPLCYVNMINLTSKLFFYGLLSVLCFFIYLCLKLFKIVFMKNVQNIILGISGAGGVELANNIDIPTTGETKDIISIIIQLAIGVVTLLGLLKKKKPLN